MVKTKDSAIEACLHRIVRLANSKGEEVTLKDARSRAETELGLEAGFLKRPEWKSRSKEVIETAFNEELGENAEQAQEPEQTPAKAGKEDASNPQKSKKKRRTESAGDDKPAATPPKRPETTAPKVNGVKRKAQESDPTGGDSSKQTVPRGKEASAEPANKKAKVSSPETSEESSSESMEEDSSSEEESSEVEKEVAQKQPSPAKPAATATTAVKDAIQAIPAKAFKPPSGYTAVNSSLLQDSSTYSASNLKGKQIWHITAPSSIPLSALTELAIPTNAQNQPILTHNNITYTIADDHTVGTDSTALFVPTSKGYQNCPQAISRTLCLRQHISLPNLDALQASQVTGSTAAADIAQPAVNIVRSQPKGLRMRFKPPGFGEGKPGKIGSETDGEGEEGADGTRPGFQFPKALGQYGTQVRQDGDVQMVDAADVAEAEKTEKQGKKKKKKRTESGSGRKDDAVVNGVGASAPAGNDAAPASKATLPNGDTGEKESKEEKKRRKEEKRAKKEAKAKRSA